MSRAEILAGSRGSHKSIGFQECGGVGRSRPRFLCFNDLLRIRLKLMKSVAWGLPLTLAECSSPLSVPFYTPSHYGCVLVC